ARPGGAGASGRGRVRTGSRRASLRDGAGRRPGSALLAALVVLLLGRGLAAGGRRGLVALGGRGALGGAFGGGRRARGDGTFGRHGFGGRRGSEVDLELADAREQRFRIGDELDALGHLERAGVDGGAAL